MVNRHDDYLQAEAGRQRRQRVARTESAEQQAFIDLVQVHANHPVYGRIAECIYSIPNGADVAEHHRARLCREGLAAGYPDIGIDIARGGYHGLRIEFKRPGITPRLRQEQRQRALILEREGYYCCVHNDAQDAWVTCCRYVDNKIRNLSP